jgi:hypothetical protein
MGSYRKGKWELKKTQRNLRFFYTCVLTVKKIVEIGKKPLR